MCAFKFTALLGYLLCHLFEQFHGVAALRPPYATQHQEERVDPPVVRTSSGLVSGSRVTSVTGKTVDQFLGIPYATPPLGQLRFKHPRPLDPWSGVFNATLPPYSCYQLDDTTFGDTFPGSTVWNSPTPFSEDCLTLSIWAPTPRPPRPLAVLVWVFGGCFYSGTISLDMYDGRTIVGEEGLLLVSLNYRLGNLGFLYLEKGRTEAPGNAGMFDQIMAFQWIRTNIAAFGGDPDRVTLFGESAGAVSIAFHLLSPLSRGLFSQAILQSGGPTVPWGTTRTEKMNRRGLLLAQAVGCPTDEEAAHLIVECLRKVDPGHLVGNETNEILGVVEFPFTPIVDGVFLDDSPENLLERGDTKRRTKLLLGSNSEEGNYFIVYHLTELFKKEEDVFLTREDFIRAVNDLTPTMTSIGQEAIVYQYTDWRNPHDSTVNRDAIDKIVGDYHFTCHVSAVADQYASMPGEEVFMYYFTHRSSQSPWPKWMGTLHGDEISFVFGEPLNPKYSYTEEEIALSRKMMHFWANFAKNGNPTVKDGNVWMQLHWPPYTYHSKEYYTLEAGNKSNIGFGPRTKQCAFWKDYLPKLVKDVTKLKETSEQLCALNLAPTSQSSAFVVVLAACLILGWL